jgi:hypothetical protein|tara:strand:+ start:42 stop:404 length:363 start_codon:yes stop_codon:yes gene_type:complete
MSGYWNVITKVAQQPAVKKAISKVVDYAVKKTPKKFKVAKTIKSQPPHTGTLKKTRGVFDELAGAASKGRKPGMYGPKETTNILMKGTPGRGPHTGKMQKLHDIVSKSGKLAQELKKHKK